MQSTQEGKENQQCLTRGIQFLAGLNERYQGKKLSNQQPIKLENQTLTLQFEDGDTLEVSFNDAGEDWYYQESYLIINNTGTESFEASIP